MQLITIFIIKMLDNALSTSKSIHIAKEQYLRGAILNAISTFFYFLVIVQLTKNNSMQNVLAICMATFVGTYISGTMLRRTEGDRLYIYRVTAEDFDKGCLFADAIRENNIGITTSICYDKNNNKTLYCEVYCKSKHDSRIISTLMDSGFKYHILHNTINS